VIERLAPEARAVMREDIARAGGREVSFVARLDGNGELVDVRAVARGTVDMVLALPGVADRGEMLLHNHPSGRLDPSTADLTVAAQLHDGAVGKALGGFEDRPSQRDMAAYIADTYNGGGIALLEAGTGVGKSFAYLVPALAWARDNSERTVVSTNTINLQEQLVGKDLPILARALATPDHTPTFALLKGWRNYLCLARLDQARAVPDSLF